ncbi:MAG: YaeQ family protein, partial [Verrucomicrobiota bacterium]
VGTQSAARLHTASKAAARVVVFTQHDPRLLAKEAASRPIHKADQIEVYALPAEFLDELAALTDRNARWSLLRNDGTLFVTAGVQTVSAPLTKHALV